jgi:hypothetical protein|nr:hypothetical protein [Alistipes onderdonkii]
MDIRYYDLLSTAIIGVIVVAIINYLFFGNLEIDGVVYLALGYLVGYFINALGSLLESLYYKTINGMPSDKFLTLVEGRNWTGCNRVKFYEAEKVIEALKNELNDPRASERKMFGCAMRRVNGCEDSRVPAFNAQYAWSRTILTTILIVDFLCAFRYYNNWLFWLMAVILLVISWNRFKERGYYYAREVLNEYLKQTN